ncbi:glutamine synthetase III [bacterium]|nr:glutamine synthetase III [bacterium]MCI0605125.1 glutamine synthetase III [bacterium]
MSTQGLSGNFGRLMAIQEIGRRSPRQFRDKKAGRISDYYGLNTFGHKKMKERLPEKVYEKLRNTISHGERIDVSIATEVAAAVKEWAVEHGATHFCHWFQPQTGLTAEKHDAFLTLTGEGEPIEKLSASQLIQGEPDASSFPSGGMRSTFEARGYTAWDPSSPMFLMEGPNGSTLCIPSVFISYTGHALDQKTPLLRSMEVLNQKTLSVLRMFGKKNAQRVVPTVGVEQEYFLIDRAFYLLRPDLQFAGRTLIGARPPKGQELEDHYFGSIESRVLGFMQECEYELFKLGIPVKTRHNEVAPGQFECAPIFEEANVAADHNQMMMEVFRKVAGLHNFTLLLHEKPFAGVNGSGKHNNWSLMDNEGNNLLEPGSTPQENLQFLVILCSVLKAVHRRAGLLRAAIASSGNDHRLGANEAPPAIISVFLGKQLSDILDSIESGQVKGETTEQNIINLRIAKLPEIAQDYTDRNRTSPFAFTGNKFEFRAVGSSSSISWPMCVLNAAVAEALENMQGSISNRTKNGLDLQKASMEAIREAIVETKTVRFEGNNYTDEWQIEAERRGLPNLRKTPEALDWLVRPESSEFFKHLGILEPEENEARYHVRLERYLKDVEIEVEVLKDLAHTSILPAAYKQQSMVAEALKTYLDAAHSTGLPTHSVSFQSRMLEQITTLIGLLLERIAEMDKHVGEASHIDSMQEKAHFYAYQIMTSCAAVRDACDKIEEIVDDQLWPLPKYHEMLFLE